jgi:Exportin-T
MRMEAKNPGASSKKPRLNYAGYPLTAHGELMTALVQSDICSYPHSSVVMQFFEAVGRYGDFFRTRKECASPVLSAFIDIRYDFVFLFGVIESLAPPSLEESTTLGPTYVVDYSIFFIGSSRISDPRFLMN